MDTPWPVEIRPVGPAACATMVWRFRGQLQVTAIVRAAFSFVPAGAMAIEAPDAILAADLHYDGDPGAGLWAASELTPYRRLADVVLVGHAHVSPGQRQARLALFQQETPLDKAIRVESRSSGAVPLRHEPAGFGPIARAWPARARLLGALDPAVLTRPVAEVPDVFDWSYFQAAPPDQRAAFLRGDEWILLEGLHPDHAVLQMRLPDVTAAGRVYGLSAGAAPIELHADSLHVDTDRQRCSLTFRGHFPVPDLASLAKIVVLAGVELADRPIRWPESVQLLPAAIDAPAELDDIDVIEDIEPDDDDDAEFGMATIPFEVTEPVAPPPSRAPRQTTMLLTWPESGPPPLQATSARQVTMIWSEGDPAPAPFEDPDTSTLEIRTKAPTKPALPFQPSAEAPAPAPPEPAEPQEDPWLNSTVALGHAAVPRSMSTPFQLAEPGSLKAGPLADIPGAPWASAPAAAAPPMPRGRQDTLTSVEPITLPPPRAAAVEDFAEEPTSPQLEAIRPAPPEPAPPPPEPPPSAPALDAPPDRPWSWATTAEPARAEGPAPAPRRPGPDIKVQRSIYERFNSTGKK